MLDKAKTAAKPSRKSKPKVEPTPKTLDNTNPAEAKASRVEVIGDPDAWKVIAKGWNDVEKWMKTTKGMKAGGGVLVQSETQHINPDGSSSLSMAMVFIPNATIVQQPDGGREIKPSR